MLTKDLILFKFIFKLQFCSFNTSSPYLDKIFLKKFHGQKPFLKPSQLHFSCIKHYSPCISSLGRVLHCSKVSNFSFFFIFGSLNCLFMSFLCFRNHKHAFSSIKTISKIHFFQIKNPYGRPPFLQKSLSCNVFSAPKLTPLNLESCFH